MSVWMIFAILGIYPITPANYFYTFTAPVFDEIKIHLKEGYYIKKAGYIQE